jgi:hypothetical protein
MLDGDIDSYSGCRYVLRNGTKGTIVNVTKDEYDYEVFYVDDSGKSGKCIHTVSGFYVGRPDFDIISIDRKKKIKSSQSKKASTVEVLLNTFIGFTISMAANHIVLPWFGYSPSISDSFLITVCFTLISIVRSYFIRRFFNYLHEKGIFK